MEEDSSAANQGKKQQRMQKTNSKTIEGSNRFPCNSANSAIKKVDND